VQDCYLEDRGFEFHLQRHIITKKFAAPALHTHTHTDFKIRLKQTIHIIYMNKVLVKENWLLSNSRWRWPRGRWAAVRRSGRSGLALHCGFHRPASWAARSPNSKTPGLKHAFLVSEKYALNGIQWSEKQESMFYQTFHGLHDLWTRRHQTWNTRCWWVKNTL